MFWKESEYLQMPSWVLISHLLLSAGIFFSLKFCDIFIPIQAQLPLLQSGTDISCPTFSVGNPVKSAAPVRLAAQSQINSQNFGFSVTENNNNLAWHFSVSLFVIPNSSFSLFKHKCYSWFQLAGTYPPVCVAILFCVLIKQAWELEQTVLCSQRRNSLW